MQSIPTSRALITLAALSIVAFLVACVVWFAGQVTWVSGRIMQYAVAFTLLEAFALVFMVLGLVTVKAIRQVRQRENARRKQVVLELLFGDCNFLEADHLASCWPEQFLEAAAEALGVLPGTERKPILQIIHRDSCRSLLLAEVEATQTYRVARAIRLLGELQDQECWTAIRKKLDHSSGFVRVAAAQAILRQGPDDWKLEILLALPRMQLWARLVISHSIAPGEPALNLFFAKMFASVDDDDLVLAGLDMVCTRRLVETTLVSRGLAGSANREVRIRFFKAIPYLNVDGDITSVLRQGLGDQDWTVRTMAAKASAHFRPAALAHSLVTICRSARNPVEARHAARALAALGGEAYLQLERLAGAGVDILSQIAAEVVEERILALAGAGR